MATRTNHCWTEEEREIVRREYRHTRESRRHLAAKLGVTEYAVAGQIGRMGLGEDHGTPALDPKGGREVVRADTQNAS